MKYQRSIISLVVWLCLIGMVRAQEGNPISQKMGGNNHPVVAIKTNLLSDVLLVPNLEAEFPINNRWSVLAECAGAWWLKKHTWCMQVESVGVEGRYWFGQASMSPQNHFKGLHRVGPMKGWFLGAFVSMANYDLQLQADKGVQIKKFKAAGISGGYVQTFNKHLRLEYSLGIGLAQYESHKYDVQKNSMLLRDGGPTRKTGVLPVKAKVALCWVLYQDFFTKKQKHAIRNY